MRSPPLVCDTKYAHREGAVGASWIAASTGAPPTKLTHTLTPSPTTPHPPLPPTSPPGLGTAPNLRYYASRMESVLGMDLNTATQPYARAAAEAAGLPPARLRLVAGSAEALPLATRRWTRWWAPM